MKKMIAYTAFVGGLLLLLVPRYILPACEYEGYAAMHCSDTAKAEYRIGVLLMLTGASTLLVRTTMLQMITATIALVLFVISYFMPDAFGYCRSARMPCNYGMVPGIWFIDLTGVLIMLTLVVILVKKYFKKGKL